MIILQYIRSVLFILQMYVAMVLFALFYLPLTLLDASRAVPGVHNYCRWVRWTASWMVGLKSEIRGEVPQDEVIVASKHQSFFDILIICSVLPKPKFIMKAQLRFAPIVGWYALKIGCVPVNRGKRSQAIKKMVEDVKAGRQEPGQLVIYPQGTRVAAGAHLPYKIGAGILYEETGQPLVPAACNVGVFWPRHGILRKPGLAVVEFLPRVEPGRDKTEVMAHLVEVIERESNRLMAEAGFAVPERPAESS